jgi:glycosyltransferase involved in cell wall biosynthesis
LTSRKRSEDRPETKAHRNRRRVLFLVGQLGFGGSEGQLSLLLAHLDHSLWRPHVLVYHPSPNDDHVKYLRDRGVEVSTLPPGAGGPIAKAINTMRLARRLRPDVVQSWTVHDNPFAAGAGWIAGSKIRWGSLRGSTALPGFRSLPSWYRRLALTAVNKIVVNSKALAAELQTLGIGRDRIMVLPNCVAPSAARDESSEAGCFEEFGFSAAHRVFGCVGNIRRVKNQKLFVRAMARVMVKRPDVRGVIVGETLDGEDEILADLIRGIEDAGLNGKIAIAGFRSDVRDLMRGFTALCMTSDLEGMPNVVLEAMAEGVPVIATAVGGVPEIVTHGETGFLIEPGDENALEESVLKILAEPNVARQMARVALERVLVDRTCSSTARLLEAAYRAELEGAV